MICKVESQATGQYSLYLSDFGEKISLVKFGQKLQFNTRNEEIGLLARAIGRMETRLDMAVGRLNKLRPVEKG